MIHIESVVNDIFTSITYILTTDKANDVWLVDCGDVDKVYEKIGDKRVAGILLTHGHFDHIYGVPALLTGFPDCNVCTTSDGFDMLADGKLSLARYYGIKVEAYPSTRTICKEGDRIKLFEGTSAIVYETPGHHPSCLTFVIGDYIFTGDAYIPGKDVVIELPGSDKIQAQHSINRIKTLAGNRVLLCGHKI